MSHAPVEPTLRRLFGDLTLAAPALRVFLSASKVAHEVGASNWTVSMGAGKLRLNFGWVEVLTMVPRSGQCGLALGPGPLPRLPRDVDIGETFYHSAPGCSRAAGPLEAIVSTFPKWESSFRRAVTAILHGPRAGTTEPRRNAHRQDLIELLASRLGVNAPVPTWWGTSTSTIEPAIEAFDALNETDARGRVFASIAARRGQDSFRAALLEAYGMRCSVTGCDAIEALEAAHILPYRGKHSHHVSNGLLLRADVHTLFDLHALSVDPERMAVVLSPALRETSYAPLHGKKLCLPKSVAARPDRAALKRHRDACSF